MDHSNSQPAKKNLIILYLLPILLGVIGCLVMYWILRGNNRKMIIKGLLLGIIPTIGLFILINIVIYSLLNSIRLSF